MHTISNPPNNPVRVRAWNLRPAAYPTSTLFGTAIAGDIAASIRHRSDNNLISTHKKYIFTKVKISIKLSIIYLPLKYVYS